MPDIAQKVSAACEYLDNDENLRPHVKWYYKTLVSRLTVGDLTTEELMSMVAVLVPAHARKLSAPHSAEPPGGVRLVVDHTVQGLRLITDRIAN